MDITWLNFADTSAITLISSCLKYSSPFSSKIFGILIPSLFTISSSVSTNSFPSSFAIALPKVVLPDPGIPMNTMFLFLLYNSFSTLSDKLSSDCSPVNISLATLACSTSIPSPLALAMPNSSALSNNVVLSGL